MLSLLSDFPDIKYIDIFSTVDNFIRGLCSCEFILSSSLHGLVIADAFGIPNQWVYISDKVEASGYKFRDYYSAYEIPCPAYHPLCADIMQKIDSLTALYERPGLKNIQQALLDSFPAHLRDQTS